MQLQLEQEELQSLQEREAQIKQLEVKICSNTKKYDKFKKKNRRENIETFNKDN